MIYQLKQDYYVRPLRSEDLDGPYTKWFEDQEVCKFNRHGTFPKTRKYFDAFFDTLNQEDKIVWAICHGSDGHVGNISLDNIDFINRSAAFTIIVGDRRHWGKGVGNLAGHKLLCHGFQKINLNRIYCGTASTNEGMKKLALSLGMQQEGIRRNHLFLENEWVDMVEFGILRSEFDV
jgi:RimJ/RimL family protein N-acetyltransferase